MQSIDDHSIILFSECSYRWMESTFSAGEQKAAHGDRVGDYRETGSL